MPIAKASGGDFQPAPTGTHLARCVGVIALGTQQPGNPTFNAAFKVLLVWELPDEMVGDKAMTCHAEYGCFLGEKANLRHDLESWRGRPFTSQELDGFDVAQVLDVPCMISIIHKPSGKGAVYAKVTAVSKLPKSMQPKPRVNELIHFEIEQGRDTTFAKLPKWIQDKIAKCDEWQQKAPADPGAMRAPEDGPDREREPDAPPPPPPDDDNCPF